MKKNDSLDQSSQTPGFWVCTGLLALLFASIASRDITRPFYGLHSWAQASGAWVARSHVKYGLGYTKGLSTWAVGDPPPKNPTRYLDHPQLGGLLSGMAMAIFGINEWAPRVVAIITGIGSLILFLKILRGLLDEKTALLAGLILVLFPLNGYFGMGGWLALFSFLAIWCYLVLIRALKDGPPPSAMHKYGLAVSLFLMLQLSWAGFFYAFTIGSHYILFHCIRRKQLPEKSMLAVLIIAPLLSFAITLAIMASGYDWDINKIVELYKWRSAKGEFEKVMEKFDWGKWRATLWQFAVTNFTTPVLITAILYMTFGQLMVFAAPGSKDNQQKPSRRFPQLWLFLIPGISLLLAFRGLVWKHQYWQRPLAPFIAIAAALGVMLLADILKKVHRGLSVACILVVIGLFSVFCAIGTNYYYAIRWQAPEKIRMFKMLNQKIPPDKALLSYEHLMVNQHGSKGGFYRPEIAWYLDRDIVQAKSWAQIQKYAQTGRYPYYLVPYVDQLSPLVGQLQKRYKFQYIPGSPGERTDDNKFLKAGMMTYMIFDLTSKASD